MLEKITQSLAGRVAIFKLLPFDNAELKNSKLLEDDWKKLLYKGYYPAIYDRGLEPRIFYNNYLQTYIDRDVTALTKVQDVGKFRNFLGLCAARSSQIFNLSHIANECGISQPTEKSWLSILESSYIIFLLRPYFENFSKRVIKSPKIYFYDVGLLSFLLGIRSLDELDNKQLLGNLFENLVVADMIKKNHHQYSLKEYWFWRDSNGHEIDLLTKTGSSFDIYEIKSTSTIQSKLFKGLDFFDGISDGRVQNKTIVYSGEQIQNRSKYKILPWHSD